MKGRNDSSIIIVWGAVVWNCISLYLNFDLTAKYTYVQNECLFSMWCLVKDFNETPNNEEEIISQLWDIIWF